MASDQLSVVRDELRQLAWLDPPRVGRRRRILGADTHRYRSSPESIADVEQLEELAGATLPQDFRRFLITVGSGAGPYHGISSVAEIGAELETMRIEADHAGLPWPRPDLPFPLSREQAAEAVAQRRTIAASALLDGCLVIGHQGSATQWTVLAVSGPVAGTVWDLGWFAGLDAEWWPGRQAPTVLGIERPPVDLATPPTFLEWFRAWLGSARSALGGAREP